MVDGPNTNRTHARPSEKKGNAKESSGDAATARLRVHAMTAAARSLDANPRRLPAP
jgi:hypothetical protein